MMNLAKLYTSNKVQQKCILINRRKKKYESTLQGNLAYIHRVRVANNRSAVCFSLYRLVLQITTELDSVYTNIFTKKNSSVIQSRVHVQDSQFSVEENATSLLFLALVSKNIIQ